MGGGGCSSTVVLLLLGGGGEEGCEKPKKINIVNSITPARYVFTENNTVHI